MVISGQIVSADKSPELKAIYSVNASGFNMACIAIPFLSTFYPAGVPYLCMFDVGDSFYTLGTTYAIGKMRLNGGSKDKNENYVLTILKGLLTSVPFDTYMIMTILSFLNCRLPDFITMAADFCGKGNGFLTMIMIGVSLELHMSRESAKEVITTAFNALCYWYYCSCAYILRTSGTASYETDISGGNVRIISGCVNNI